MGNTLEQHPIFINHLEQNTAEQSNHNNALIVEPTKTKKTKTYKNPTSLKKNSISLVNSH